MTTSLLQGELTIARLCTLAGVSRAGYYRPFVLTVTQSQPPLGAVF